MDSWVISVTNREEKRSQKSMHITIMGEVKTNENAIVWTVRVLSTKINLATWTGAFEKDKNSMFKKKINNDRTRSIQERRSFVHYLEIARFPISEGHIEWPVYYQDGFPLSVDWGKLLDVSDTFHEITLEAPTINQIYQRLETVKIQAQKD